MRADPLLAEELNTFYGRFDCNGGANLPISAVTYISAGIQLYKSPEGGAAKESAAL